MVRTERDKSGNVTSSLEKKFTEGRLDNLLNFKPPFFNGCLLSNVFSTPNTDANYNPLGYFYSVINNPLDFISFDWFIEKYLETEFLPKLNAATKLDIKFSKNDIKIHNFSIKEKNTPTGKTGETYELKGDIYVVNVNKLNKQIQQKLLPLPLELENTIKDFGAQKK